MLIITRKLGERVTIGDDVTVTLLEIKGGQVRLGIQAPRNVAIHREEIYERIMAENLESSVVSESDLAEAASILNINSASEEPC